MTMTALAESTRTFDIAHDIASRVSRDVEYVAFATTQEIMRDAPDTSHRAAVCFAIIAATVVARQDRPVVTTYGDDSTRVDVEFSDGLSIAVVERAPLIRGVRIPGLSDGWRGVVAQRLSRKQGHGPFAAPTREPTLSELRAAREALYAERGI